MMLNVLQKEHLTIQLHGSKTGLRLRKLQKNPANTSKQKLQVKLLTIYIIKYRPLSTNLGALLLGLPTCKYIY